MVGFWTVYDLDHTKPVMYVLPIQTSLINSQISWWAVLELLSTECTISFCEHQVIAIPVVYMVAECGLSTRGPGMVP